MFHYRITLVELVCSYSAANGTSVLLQSASSTILVGYIAWFREIHDIDGPFLHSRSFRFTQTSLV